LAKPLPRAELVSRVQAALAHKRIQDRSDHLHKQLMQLNADLEATMTARSSDLSRVRKTLLYALARIVQSRTQETPGHLNRIGRYTTALALQARTLARSGPLLNDAFIQVLETCAPLHDIGNVAMPDHILQHSGKLAPEDRIVMQAHTTIGAETLASVAKKDRSAAAFWQTAIDITRHHHENYDGTGYPDRLTGANIPLAARLVSVADAYDSLRTTSEMGIALSHNAAVEMIVEGTKGRFDPQLLHAFQEAHVQFDEIFRAFPEREVAPEEECARPRQVHA
jgi:response regulator RpfG family c-di-GMP phosphodiesterase